MTSKADQQPLLHVCPASAYCIGRAAARECVDGRLALTAHVSQCHCAHAAPWIPVRHTRRHIQPRKHSCWLTFGLFVIPARGQGCAGDTSPAWNAVGPCMHAY
eukprot:365255-Chlamydomonas_euryale.AAC.33